MPDEFDLEAWWEDESKEPFGPEAQIRMFDIPSRGKISAWGDVGTIGLNTAIPEGEMENILITTFQRFQTTKITDEWFYVVRRCDALDTHEYVVASEDIIYNSRTNTRSRNGYAAQPLAEVYFHILRAYARAYENDFEAAQIIWTDIHENWLHHANDYRKPFILLSLYLTSLCTNEWRQCMRYLRQFWSLIKFMDGTKRHAFGIWDEWTTCLLVSWFFMKYSADFRKIFCGDYLAQSDPFTFQKKSIILQNLNNSFIADMIPKAYYNKAMELNPKLPKIEYKEKKIAQI